MLRLDAAGIALGGSGGDGEAYHVAAERQVDPRSHSHGDEGVCSADGRATHGIGAVRADDVVRRAVAEGGGWADDLPRGWHRRLHVLHEVPARQQRRVLHAGPADAGGGGQCSCEDLRRRGQGAQAHGGDGQQAFHGAEARSGRVGQVLRGGVRHRVHDGGDRQHDERCGDEGA